MGGMNNVNTAYARLKWALTVTFSHKKRRTEMFRV